MNIFVRPESHEIDSLARRRVPSAIPPAWEQRELTGRDYGIDMLIELFKDGNATGDLLSLQIKGTSKKIINEDKIIFDVPVRTLIYSEMFMVPVLLVLCPVKSEQNEFYYLWLQEYIKIVLNHENLNWRNNSSKVRVKIPVGNHMPGDEAKIEFISRFPKRIFDWCQYARICEDLKYSLESFFDFDKLLLQDYQGHSDNSEINQYIKGDLKKIICLLNEMIALEGIFKEKDWNYSLCLLKETILPALDAANELIENTSIDRVEAKKKLASLSSISNLLGLYNDYSFSRILWEQDGLHNF
ncbi:MAG: hypothetical protein APF84_07700 [Gracilibacter sp. BRH_c7a]|nr:MAG: hypothetical protein APF84_07700 [Gracilibacter sp. BRH_c7a]